MEVLITASKDRSVGILRLGAPNHGWTEYSELTWSFFKKVVFIERDLLQLTIVLSEVKLINNMK